MRKPVKQEFISTLLRDRILSGYYPRGEKLPEERSLSAELGISRKTLRAALERLESENLLVRHPRLGTFVHLGASGMENFCYYILPCHDLQKNMNYSSVIGHLRLMSGIVQACAARQVQSVMLPLSNDNNPEHLLEERLRNLPSGARLIFCGASWYQSLFPLPVSQRFRIVMYHTCPEGYDRNLPDILFIGFDGTAFIRAGVDFLKHFGCKRPLFVMEKGRTVIPGLDFPSIQIISSDPREISKIREAFSSFHCDAIFCETFPRVSALWSFNTLLHIPENIPILMNDNLMDFSSMAKPPHLIGFDLRHMADRGINFLFSALPGGHELCSQIIFNKYSLEGGS